MLIQNSLLTWNTHLFKVWLLLVLVKKFTVANTDIMDDYNYCFTVLDFNLENWFGLDAMNLNKYNMIQFPLTFVRLPTNSTYFRFKFNGMHHSKASWDMLIFINFQWPRFIWKQRKTFIKMKITSKRILMVFCFIARMKTYEKPNCFVQSPLHQ